MMMEKKNNMPSMLSFYMKITHLTQSGILIELDQHILLFDYYQGELHINPHKPLYIFVSHRHYDHYNPSIFKIHHPHTAYILSSDLRHNHTGFYVDPNQEYDFDDIHIKTLLSTDEGCAFIVQVEGKTIYHAGDLHWWHWIGEPEKDNDYQRITYQQQIHLINEKIDYAFVVVDPRLEDAYLLGLQYFLNHVEAKYVFPIHYFGDYSTTDKLAKENLYNPYQAQLITFHHPQETYEIL